MSQQGPFYTVQRVDVLVGRGSFWDVDQKELKAK